LALLNANGSYCSIPYRSVDFDDLLCPPITRRKAGLRVRATGKWIPERPRLTISPVKQDARLPLPQQKSCKVALSSNTVAESMYLQYSLDCACYDSVSAIEGLDEEGLSLFSAFAISVAEIRSPVRLH
jgi:hypothetical protein